MPEIPSIGHGGVGPINRTAGRSAATSSTTPRDIAEPRGDRVELSEHARLLDRLRQLPEVRTELLERFRQEIAAGTYLTPEKIDAAIERLLQDGVE